MINTNYILITSAHNEEKLIGNTIKSVLNQTMKPIEWVIIDDGSSDNTSTIVKNFTTKNQFIKLITKNSSSPRDFASKVNAIRLAVSKISCNDYKYIGILDADITFNSEYYRNIIDRMEVDPKLGIAGGKITDLIDGKLIPLYLHPNIVRGAVQFFRRKCYEEIGGLLPLKYGGEDTAACFSARLKGWEVKNFTEFEGFHHRLTGTADRSIIRARFRNGFVEYHLGYHPFFQFVKCLSRIKEKPIVIGSLFRFIGFWWATIKQEQRIISIEHQAFVRKEQLDRLFKLRFF